VQAQFSDYNFAPQANTKMDAAPTTDDFIHSRLHNLKIAGEKDRAALVSGPDLFHLSFSSTDRRPRG
jgi:hypothetical protein